MNLIPPRNKRDTLRSIANAAKQWGVKFIRCEPNYGGGMFDKLLAPWLLKVGSGGLTASTNYQWRYLVIQ